MKMKNGSAMNAKNGVPNGHSIENLILISTPFERPHE